MSDVTTQTCTHCGRPDCDQWVTEHLIRMSGNKAYAVRCCMNEAKRLQDGEDLRQKGIRADMIAGLGRLVGLPERFKDADFSNFKITLENGEAVGAALNFVNGFVEKKETDRGIVFVGSVGVGKTHLGCAILNRLVMQGVSCRYVYAESFLDLCRRRPQDQSEIGYLTLRAFCEERLIFLDDVGIGTDTEWTEAQYTKLLDARYREKRPIVLATNLGLEDLKKVIGERCLSRLIESNDIVEMGGEDRRLG